MKPDSCQTEQYVVVFQSVHSTLQFETILRGLEITYQIIPTPRKISADCGLAIKLSPAGWKTLSQALLQASLEADPKPALHTPWKTSTSFQVYRILEEGEPRLIIDSR